MTPTKEQWQEIETSLSGDFGCVKLRADGYVITASIERLKPLQNCVAVYIAGRIEGKWLRGGHEIPLKFHREKKIFVWSLKQRVEAKKKLLNRKLDKDLRNLYQDMAGSRFSIWEPYWTNPAAFIRHIRKSCTSIEQIKIGYDG